MFHTHLNRINLPILISRVVCQPNLKRLLFLGMILIQKRFHGKCDFHHMPSTLLKLCFCDYLQQRFIFVNANCILYLLTSIKTYLLNKRHHCCFRGTIVASDVKTTTHFDTNSSARGGHVTMTSLNEVCSQNILSLLHDSCQFVGLQQIWHEALISRIQLTSRSSHAGTRIQEFMLWWYSVEMVLTLGTLDHALTNF